MHFAILSLPPQKAIEPPYVLALFEPPYNLKRQALESIRDHSRFPTDLPRSVFIFSGFVSPRCFLRAEQAPHAQSDWAGRWRANQRDSRGHLETKTTGIMGSGLCRKPMAEAT